jgi:tRNA A37 threonylcarbamoyladenosine modification protein TsaB
MEDAFPDAKFMKALLDSEQEQSEDVAYFEPFYLKDFVAEKSKKKWL